MGGLTDWVFPGSQYLNFGDGGGGGGNDSPGYQPTPQRQLQQQAYQPNFESFWDPMAMSQAGQPSFDNPFWYNATPAPQQQAPVPPSPVPQQQTNPLSAEQEQLWNQMAAFIKRRSYMS